MKRFIKTILITSSLLTAGFTFRPDPLDDLLAKLLKGLDQHYRRSAVEAIYIQHDKGVYAAGEMLWYKLSLITPYSDPGSTSSRIAYVDLMHNGTKVFEQKVKLTDRSGSASINLPDTLTSGLYQLIAYTEWMKSSKLSIPHSVPIPVYNPLKSPPENQVNPTLSAQVDVFPEGGALIDGLASKVVVRLSGDSRYSLKANGRVLDQDDNEVATFSTANNGYGAFMLLPSSERKYRVQLGTDDEKLETDLPAVHETGVAMNVNNQLGEDIKIYVQGRKYRKKVLLVVQARGRIYFTAKGDLSKKYFITSIPRDQLPEGIVQVSILDEEAEVHGERLLYNHKTKDQIRLQSDKMEYSARETVTLNISTDIVPMELAISVTPEELTQEQNSSRDFLASEAGDPIGVTSLKTGIDNIMITRKWARHSWEDILSGTVSSSAQREDLLTVKARATYKDNGEPVKLRQFFLILPEEKMIMQDVSNDRGELLFPVFDFKGEKTGLIDVIDEGFRENIEIRLDEAVDSYSMSAVTDSELTYGDDIIGFIEAHNRISQIRNAYYSYPLNEQKLDDEEFPLRFYRHFDNEVILEEFIEFPNMKEVFREIVEGVIVRSRKGVPFLRVYSKELDYKFEGTPLILINGKPTYDQRSVFSLKPGEVHSVEVLSSRKSLEPFGIIGKNGIIAIYTKNPEMIVESVETENRFRILGFAEESDFMKAYPQLSEKDPRIPVYANIVYWNPHVVTDSNGDALLKFQLPDNTGNFKILVSGITAQGTPIYGSLTVRVVK